MYTKRRIELKTNKLTSSLLIATLLLSGSVATASTVLAANGRTDDKTGATNANITFDEKATDPVTPIDPIDPTDPVTPTSGLSLIYVTDSLDFGTHKANITEDFAGEKGDLEYKDGVAVDGTNKFQMSVLDARNAAADWAVAGDITTEGATGVTLTFPSSTDFYSNVKGSNENVEALGGTIGKGSAATIFSTQAAKTAPGQTAMQMDVKDIKMHVPFAGQTGEVTSTITWTLSSKIAE